MLRDKALIPLSHQHQHALALCVQIDRTLAAGAAAGAVETLGKNVVQHFELEMRAHFRLEEQALFPAMSDFDTTRDLVASLIADHRRLEALRDSMHASVDGTDLEEFSALLRAHVRKEENVLFEEAQRLLNPEQIAAIGKQLAG